MCPIPPLGGLAAGNGAPRSTEARQAPAARAAGQGVGPRPRFGAITQTSERELTGRWLADPTQEALIGTGG